MDIIDLLHNAIDELSRAQEFLIEHIDPDEDGSFISDREILIEDISLSIDRLWDWIVDNGESD